MTSQVIGSISDLSRKQIDAVFAYADMGPELFRQFADSAKGRILGSLFFQPSTRTALSFKSAFMRLGGNCVGFSDIEQSRSGSTAHERIPDAARVISKYCDCIILRTPDAKLFQDFASYCTVPIISAGHGHVEHPTSGLNNLFTMKQVIGYLDGLTILAVAQLPKRTIHSFLLAASLWTDITMYLVTPPGHELESSLEQTLRQRFKELTVFPSFQSFSKAIDLTTVDAIILEETLADYAPGAYFDRHRPFCLTKEVLERFRPDVFITHPLPRIRMLPEEIDDTPNSHYFTMAGNGPFTRAGLFIETVLKTS